jgi:hypothetical protein
LHEVAVKRAVALNAVLRPAVISQSEFFAWNPALEPNTKVLPVGYRVKLPAEKVNSFVTAHSRVVNAPAAKTVAAGKSKSSMQAGRRSGPNAKRITKPKSPLTGGLQSAKSTPKAKRQQARSAQPPVTLALR